MCFQCKVMDAWLTEISHMTAEQYDAIAGRYFASNGLPKYREMAKRYGIERGSDVPVHPV